MSKPFDNVSLVDANRGTVHDATTGAVNTIPYPHHEIHEGEAYFGVHSGLADDTDTIEVRIETPDTAKWAHMVMIIDTALAATAQLWEDTTVTDIPGQRFGMNKNRNSENGTGLLICHTPGGAEADTPDLEQFIGAATTGGRSDSGGGTSSRGEFVLKQATAYLIRVTSRADNNALSIILDWYEHTNRA